MQANQAEFDQEKEERIVFRRIGLMKFLEQENVILLGWVFGPLLNLKFELSNLKSDYFFGCS